jgi:hypothetical protein
MGVGCAKWLKDPMSRVRQVPMRASSAGTGIRMRASYPFVKARS